MSPCLTAINHSFENCHEQQTFLCQFTTAPSPAQGVLLGGLRTTPLPDRSMVIHSILLLISTAYAYEK